MNLAELLATGARRWPTAPAVAVGARVVHDQATLAAHVAAVAGGLRSSFGLRPGDRVAIVSANRPEYLEVLFACWHAGLVAVPVNAKLHPKELAFIFQNSEAALVCADSDHASDAAGGAPLLELGSPEYERLARGEASGVVPVEPDSPAWLFYTSGTTGHPKGATLSHANLLFMTRAYWSDIDELAPGDAILHAAPLSHGSGLWALPHAGAGTLQVIPESGGFDADEVLREIGRHPKLSFFAAPTMVTRLMNAPSIGDTDLANLRTIVYGGGPMYFSDALAAIERFGPRLYHLYGQGESPMTITGLPQSAHADTTHPRFRERLASCGFARTGVEVRVVDEHDRPLPPGEVGEVVTRSPAVMAGYWNLPEATARTLRGRWLHTGDLGSFDEDGFLTLRDRSKDLIISGGSNIYPREVEEVLLLHPRVAECSVVGRSHPDWGEEIVAFVVPHAGASVSDRELEALCLENIARFKRPREYRFVTTLPKNAYGKVLKRELRALLRGDVE